MGEEVKDLWFLIWRQWVEWRLNQGLLVGNVYVNNYIKTTRATFKIYLRLLSQQEAIRKDNWKLQILGHSTHRQKMIDENPISKKIHVRTIERKVDSKTHFQDLVWTIGQKVTHHIPTESYLSRPGLAHRATGHCPVSPSALWRPFSKKMWCAFIILWS